MLMQESAAAVISATKMLNYEDQQIQSDEVVGSARGQKRRGFISRNGVLLRDNFYLSSGSSCPALLPCGSSNKVVKWQKEFAGINGMNRRGGGGCDFDGDGVDRKNKIIMNSGDGNGHDYDNQNAKNKCPRGPLNNRPVMVQPRRGWRAHWNNVKRAQEDDGVSLG